MVEKSETDSATRTLRAQELALQEMVERARIRDARYERHLKTADLRQRKKEWEDTNRQKLREWEETAPLRAAQLRFEQSWQKTLGPIVGSLPSAAAAIVAAFFGVWSNVIAREARDYTQINYVAGVEDARGDMAFGELPKAFREQHHLPDNWLGWKHHVSFARDVSGKERPGYRPFRNIPPVIVSLKSLDASNLRGAGPRLSIAAPSDGVTSEGFDLYVYTWLDEKGAEYKPDWVEVSWFAYDEPEKK